MIKNKYFTYINTSDKQQILHIEVEVNGKTLPVTAVLEPKQVEADIVQKMKLQHGKNAKVISIVATERRVSSSGKVMTSVKAIGPSQPLSRDEIIKKSVFLDIETTGLRGPDIIHQIALYDPTEKKGLMFRPTPELIVTDKEGGEQGLSRRGRRLASRRYDVKSHKDGKFASTLIDMIKAGEDVTTMGDTVKNLANDYTTGKISVFDLAEGVVPEAGKKDVVSGVEDYLIKTDRFQALLMADEAKLETAKIGTDRATGKLTPESIEKRRVFERISSGSANTNELIEMIGKASGRDLSDISERFTGGLTWKHTSSIKDLMTGDLASALKGKVTWIANASFEAKQFGGQINDLAEESLEALNAHRGTIGTGLAPLDRDKFHKGFQYGRYEKELDTLNIDRVKAGKKELLTKNPFYGVIEGVSATSGDPFYSTNLAYNKIKAQALKSKDYSGLYEAVLKHTGEGDVRDILDLVKSQQSQLINQGIIDEKAPTSLSMEVQGRLYGFTEQMRLAETEGRQLSMDDAIKSLKEAESHMALGDTSVTEARVFSESMEQLEAKRLVDLGGAEGKELFRQASEGKGAYFRHMAYGSLANYFNQQAKLSGGEVSAGLDELGFRQRIGKSMVEMAENKSLVTRQQKPGYRVVEQVKKIGDITEKSKVQVGPKSKQVHLTSVDDVLKHLENLDEYKHVDKTQALADARTKYSGFFDASGTVVEATKGSMREVALKDAEASDKVVDMFARRLGDGQVTKQFLSNIQMFIGSRDIERTSITPATPPLKPRGSRRSIVPTPRVVPLSPPGPGAKPPSPATPPRPTPGVKPPGPIPPPPPSVPPTPKVVPPVSSAAESVSRTAQRAESPTLSKGLREIGKSHLGKYGILTGALAVLSTRTAHKEEQGELLAPNYEQFLEAQSQFYGNDQEAYINSVKAKYGRLEGLPQTGLASMLNKAFTDFGSPYQGPAYTQGVLEDHKLRRERHKYIQQKFGVRHFSEQGDIGFFFKRFLSTAFRRQMGTSKESRNIIFSGAKPIDQERYGTGVRGKNLIEYEFDKSRFEINVEDADTVSIKRKGNINSPLSSFMGTGRQDSMSIRLAGIDSPEIAHQDRRAQPFAEKAKAIASELIAKAKDVRLVGRQGDTTYGRQVGMIYVDGKNLNLELVKRGAAAYLPYKSKGKPPIYNQKAFEDAQESAQESKRGMWNTGYFQAYKEISKASGETVTFNTLANISKVSRNANLMSIYSLMNQADRAGGVTDQIMGDITQTAERFKAAQSKNSTSIFRPDKKFSSAHELDLQSFGYNTNSILSSLDQIKSDLGSMIKSRGSKKNEYKLNTRSLRENNYHMVKDTLAARNVHEAAKINKQRENQLAEMQKYKRQVMMESLQLSANKNMFNSPIGHNRM